MKGNERKKVEEHTKEIGFSTASVEGARYNLTLTTQVYATLTAVIEILLLQFHFKHFPH